MHYVKCTVRSSCDAYFLVDNPFDIVQSLFEGLVMPVSRKLLEIGSDFGLMSLVMLLVGDIGN